jgi:hypothetical protein
MQSPVSGCRVALAVLLLAVCCCATAATAGAAARPTPAGTWTGKYSGAFSGTFTLTWKQVGTKLIGTITLSSGKYGITGSLGRGGTIRFGVVKVGAVYTGTWSGKSMSGRYQTPSGGGPWSAHKSS